MVRESAQQQAKHAEIARRYASAKRKPSLLRLRVRDLMVLARSRHGEQLPDSATGRAFAIIATQHLASLPGDPSRRIGSWLKAWCPWLSLGDADDMLVQCFTKPQRWTADALAWRLRLTAIDRAALRITTIGAVDQSKPQRATNRRNRARQREQARRANAGATNRAQYLAKSISRAKPWQQLWISRASWYRQGKPTP